MHVFTNNLLSTFSNITQTEHAKESIAKHSASGKDELTKPGKSEKTDWRCVMYAD